MTILEMRLKLHEMGINWQELCPDVLNNDEKCPQEFQNFDGFKINCPQCWMKYGNVDKEAES